MSSDHLLSRTWRLGATLLACRRLQPYVIVAVCRFSSGVARIMLVL